MAFWKSQIDAVVAEKNEWAERHARAARENLMLKGELINTKKEYAELRMAVQKAFPESGTGVWTPPQHDSSSQAADRLARHRNLYTKLYVRASALQRWPAVTLNLPPPSHPVVVPLLLHQRGLVVA